MPIIDNILNITSVDLLFNIVGMAISLIIIGLVIALMHKIDQVKELKNSLNKLKKNLDEIDEQAKLIVRTDIELNKTQEELDKKISGLYTLHKISRLISSTLDENEVFKQLNEPLIQELGFENGIILMLNEQKKFVCKLSIGFTKAQIESISDSISHEFIFESLLKDAKLLSSLNTPSTIRESIFKIFNVISFVIAPISTQDGVVGILFVGDSLPSSIFTEGDEELISILANQMGQTLENARLFEQVYKSHQVLETKVKERTKELAEALEEVKTISKMKTDFISAVSHELRTPLTSIKGYASILMSGKAGELPEAVKERLEKINKHSDALVKLINDLLDISRIESGRVEMQFETHRINTIIDTVADLLMPQLKERHIDFVLDISENLKPVWIDRSQIERVFINLISNAIKFTQPHDKITVRTKDDKDFIQIDIIDTGIGIPENELSNIFKEFYRVDNPINQTIKGTGLGLSLVKNIIEAHKGKIWVNSKINQGSIFSFTLPKAK